jgi:copper chaperone CopZ
MMSKKMPVLILALLLGAALVAGAVIYDRGRLENAVPALNAMTELQIDKMTCGSCVKNIRSALSDVDGIDQVDVSVTAGSGQVFYDPQKIDAAQIARLVSAAGYPAQVRQDLSPTEYHQLQTETEQLHAAYVARIGSRLLSRQDFDQLVAWRASNMQGAPAATAGLRSSVWNELKQREILLAAAEENQVVVQDGEVEFEIEKMKADNQNFAASVQARFGSYENFFKQMKANMIINRNIEQHVLADVSDERQRQLRFSQWYAEQQRTTRVVIFDPTLKKIETAAGAGCGGSCCG